MKTLGFVVGAASSSQKCMFLSCRVVALTVWDSHEPLIFGPSKCWGEVDGRWYCFTRRNQGIIRVFRYFSATWLSQVQRLLAVYWMHSGEVEVCSMIERTNQNQPSFAPCKLSRAAKKSKNVSIRAPVSRHF